MKKYIKPSLEVVVAQSGTLLRSSIEQTEQLSKKHCGSLDWNFDDSRDSWPKQKTAWDD